jgi:gliding motility-associated-like protein
MLRKNYLLFFALLLSSSFCLAQACLNNGQNPSTAFPVCGTNTFNQASVPICAGQTVPSPTCNSTDYKDKNPYYYKFTCFAAGTLFFTINPNTNSDDYDWCLYDITGRNPNDIYSNASLTIASNWSGSGGNTGMNNDGNNAFVCEGLGRPRWSKPANLIVGHNYLLMVSHFTNSQSGYSLSFGGGTAVITDPKPPKLLSVSPDCEGKNLRLKLNKKMLCNSIASNGTDFYIYPFAGVTITGANSLQCAIGFDADTVSINLSNVLNPGNYWLKVKQGTDDNTLKDYCDNQIALTDSIPFRFTPATPTPIDSILKPTCAPTQIKLVFNNKQINCNSIASNGSDFAINGTYPTAIIGATTATCKNGFTDTIILQLDKPLFNKGIFTITLQIGSDGNSIIDECNLASIIGSSKSFAIKDTVNANFTSIIKLGCVTDTILAFNQVANEVNTWNWFIDNLQQPINTPTPQFLFTQFGYKNIGLLVSNGFCTDTSSALLYLDNFIDPITNFRLDNCPKETVNFTNNSVGLRLTHFWNFGDGATDTARNPTHNYIDFGIDKTYTVSYTITNNLGCQKTLSKPINILKICGQFVPTAFTPNGDGRNDKFGPLYAAQANDLMFKVFNRYGQLVYSSNNWRNGWDGKINGVEQPIGTYVWTMFYIDRNDNKPRYTNGTITLIR